MDKGFSRFHPMVGFLYYAFLIALVLTLSHPLHLFGILIFSISFLHLQDRQKPSIRAWRFHLGMVVIVFIFNPLLNPSGETVLFHLFHKAITREALFYGIKMSISLFSILVVFQGYSRVLHPHKMIYLFATFLPKISFLLFMVMNFIPLLRLRMNQIILVQKTQGVHIHGGKLLQRVRDGMKILQILLTWSVEEAIKTAESMKARGYGLKRRTSFFTYHFKKRDIFLLAFILVFGPILWGGFLVGHGRVSYYPNIVGLSMNGEEWIFFSILLVYLFIPLWEEGRELIKWN